MKLKKRNHPWALTLITALIASASVADAMIIDDGQYFGRIVAAKRNNVFQHERFRLTVEVPCSSRLVRGMSGLEGKKLHLGIVLEGPQPGREACLAMPTATDVDIDVWPIWRIEDADISIVNAKEGLIIEHVSLDALGTGAERFGDAALVPVSCDDSSGIGEIKGDCRSGSSSGGDGNEQK